MVKLTKQRLREILKKINTDPQTNQQYYSKLNSLLNFLNNNTGIKNAGVKESGSRAKNTGIRTSDIDVIFCTSGDQEHQVVRKHILEKAKIAFGQVANVEKGNKAIHVDFIFPKCNFDLVYVTKKKFQEEIKKIRVIKKLLPIRKDAIKLVKYAFDKANIKDIHGYEVELACIHVKSKSLVDCVEKLITYFKGRIEENKQTMHRILQRLT